MIRFLRRNEIYIWFLFTIFYSIFYVIDLFNNEKYNVVSFYSFIDSLFININNFKVLSLLLSFAFNIIIASLILNLSIEFLIIPNKNYMLVVFYYIITGVVQFYHYFHPIHISLILLILILKSLFSSSRINKFSTIFFDTGLLAGISFIIYYPSWIFLVIIFIGLIFFRNFDWREWFTAIFGFITPLILVLTYIYVFDKDLSIIDLFKSIVKDKILLSPIKIGFLIYSFFISFICMLNNANKIHTLKIITRKTISFFIVNFIFVSSVILLFFVPEFSKLLILVAVINFLFITTYYFTTCNVNRFNNIILVIFIVSPLFIYFIDNFKVFYTK